MTEKSRKQTAVCLFKPFAPSLTHFAVGRKTACRLVFREPETETGSRSAALKPRCILAWRHRVPRVSGCDANAAVTGRRYAMSWTGCNFHWLSMRGFCCRHKRSPRDSVLEMLLWEKNGEGRSHFCAQKKKSGLKALNHTCWYFKFTPYRP